MPITMDDIARLSGVNKSTVSRALAGSTTVAPGTRARIEEIVRKHGYVVNQAARGLRMQRSMLIAVLIPLQHDRQQPLSDPFFMEMLGYLADSVTLHGYDLMLSKIASGSAQWLTKFQRSRRADGLILIGQSLEHAHIAEAAKTGIPLVVWGAKLPRQGYVTVGSDNVAGGTLAAAHLLAGGRRRIAFLGDPRLPEIAQRHQGYVRAHTQAGLRPDPNLTLKAGFAPEEARAAVELLLARSNAFDAIVAASDVIALAALQVLSAHGIAIPREVAVVGFDDVGLAAHTQPALTTVRQEIRTGAQLLTRALLAKIAGGVARSSQIAPTLVVRDSS
jgi:DNA-binding LacI/PurR family transcriptional regulator